MKNSKLTKIFLITTLCSRGEWELPEVEEVSLEKKNELINGEEGYLENSLSNGNENGFEYYYFDEVGYEFFELEKGKGYIVKYGEGTILEESDEVEEGINVVEIDWDNGEFEVRIKF